MARIGRIYGHDVHLGRRTVDGIEVMLVRRWWAPLPLAWIAASMVAWWWFPVVFVWVLWAAVRSRE